MPLIITCDEGEGNELRKHDVAISIVLFLFFLRREGNNSSLTPLDTYVWGVMKVECFYYCICESKICWTDFESGEEGEMSSRFVIERVMRSCLNKISLLEKNY